MGWIILVLVITLIVQSIRASNLKYDLRTQKEITKCKLKDVELLEDDNKDLRQWLGLHRARANPNENQNVN